MEHQDILLDKSSRKESRQSYLDIKGIPSIIRFKSDNCSTQYKCKWVFRFWHSIAQKTNTKVIIYFEVSGHGKGLVDAMSAFGVKGPLMRAVITQDLHYQCAKDIHNYMSNNFRSDPAKHYFVLANYEISKYKIDRLPLVVKRCRSLHMRSFFLDGSVQSKINLCSCSNCIEGDFTSCLIEKGKFVLVTDASDDDSSSEDFDNDFDVDEESDTEMYELRAETVNDVLTKDTCIALYTLLQMPSNSFSFVRFWILE